MAWYDDIFTGMGDALAAPQYPFGSLAPQQLTPQQRRGAIGRTLMDLGGGFTQATAQGLPALSALGAAFGGVGDRASERAMNQVRQRYMDAQIANLNKPKTPEVPTSVQEFEFSQKNPAYEAFREKLARGTQPRSIAEDVSARREQALAQGMKETDPAFQSYVLTGRMPREDVQPLTAKDKEAVLTADENVHANQAAIDLLEGVIAPGAPDASGKPTPSLNQRAGAGMTAQAQAFMARNDPTGFFDKAQGEATTEYQNVVLNQALGSLKSIFGAAPTEGERKILVDLQASVDKSPGEREIILRRAVTAANRRLTFNQQRADALRNKTYYQPQAGAGAPTAPQATGQPEAAAPAPQAAPAAPQAAPGGTVKPNADGQHRQTLLRQAKEALAAGTPREKVIEALRAQGIEVE